jgi:phage terminase large subunit GpA-like protein
MKSAGPPATLGDAGAAKVRFVVWCKTCGHRSQPDPADQARWYGPETTVPAWDKRLLCGNCKQ